MLLLKMAGQKSRQKHSEKSTLLDWEFMTIYLMDSMSMVRNTVSGWELKWTIPSPEEVTDPQESVQRIRLGRMLFCNSTEYLSFDSSSTNSKDLGV